MTLAACGCPLPYNSARNCEDTHKKIYSERLQATNTSGLSIHAIRANYIMHAENSLIGQQLKTLAQVNAFHVYDLVEPLQFALTKAIGELSALLWFPEIRNLDEYLADVKTAAANVLDIAVLIDPSKVILKIKYHLLAHLREDIVRFGPLLGVATETFECFNAIFRFCSILSNHLAPSRNIALQLAEQEVLRHFLSGGGWRGSTGVEWKEPAPAVASFLGKNPFFVALLGYGRHAQPQASGNIKLEPLKRSKNRTKIARVALTLGDTLAAQAVNTPEMMQNPEVRWYQGKHVVSHAQDKCATEPPITGKILEILQDEDTAMAFVVFDVFQVSAVRHKYFGMPVLSRRLDKPTLLVIPATTIMFEYDTQHDCLQARCIASGKQAVLQERVQTELREAESFIQHNPFDRFLINTHAFHNAHPIPQEVDNP
ncbi:hypothetical protein B0H34DRAFT_670737 [Crassisporium funariophilum]|nr:hypothetical protein B0H34DRAFT_670737 [Crassisporium funariophilum]